MGPQRDFSIVRRLVINIVLVCEAHTLVLLLPHGARPKQSQQFREGDPLLQHYMLTAAAGSAGVAASDNRVCQLGRAAPSWRLPRPDQIKTLENCYEVDRKRCRPAHRYGHVGVSVRRDGGAVIRTGFDAGSSKAPPRRPS
jgi:hypothetical protein